MNRRGGGTVSVLRSELPVAGDYDVVVAGAGLAGVAAATAAARAGARTAVVECRPYAGGISTAGMEPSICNYFHDTRGELIVGGRPLELIERMVGLGAVHRNWDQHRGHVIFDVEIGKLAMDEMLDDAGVDIWYDTLVTDAVMDGKRLSGVQVANRSGNRVLQAGCVVDATGDADVAHYAGAPLHVGPGQANVHSFVFRLGNVDLDAIADFIRRNPHEYIHDTDIGLTPEEALAFYEDTGRIMFMHHGAPKMKLMQRLIERGEYSRQWGPYQHMDAFQLHGIRESRTLVVNTGWFELHEPDGKALSDWLREGRGMAQYVTDFMRRHFPGCRDCFLLATADAPGLRRTRWLDTDFTLTREIYDTAPQYEDAVGRGVVIEPGPLYKTNKTFDIPLRCLLPRRVEGLLIGSGRSASCVPAELLRTMPVTMSVGQGAGAVAAVAVREGIAPRDVDLEAVQEALSDQGVELG